MILRKLLSQSLLHTEIRDKKRWSLKFLSLSHFMTLWFLTVHLTEAFHRDCICAVWLYVLTLAFIEKFIPTWKDSVTPSEIWADFNNKKQPLCAHFAYLSHGDCSLTVFYAAEILRAISPGCSWWKNVMLHYSALRTNVSLDCCQPALTFISRILVMAKGIFWDLLKD